MYQVTETAFEELEGTTSVIQDLQNNIRITQQYWKFEGCKEYVVNDSFCCHIWEAIFIYSGLPYLTKSLHHTYKG